MREPATTLRLRGPALYTIGDTARALAIGRTKIYELIATGELGSVQVGRRRLVPAHEISDYVARLCVRSHGTANQDRLEVLPVVNEVT